MVSIIIRTKNEERWISACLSSVFQQEYEDFEVVLVDNESTDRTLEKARQFPIAKVLTCREFLPGKVLNLGIRASRGELIACLSGHCIPVNPQWLGNLVRNVAAPDVAGVYGRQEPLAFTPDADKRDLALVFGLDRKLQRKDSFFHNANSLIRRALWEQVPFDEVTTNIEDRIWAQEMLRRGHGLVYEPEARVYHYHGIHHNGNLDRCGRVVRIMERLHGESQSLELDRLNIVAIIPVRGPIPDLHGRPLLAYTIDAARASRHIKRIVVSTDSAEVADIAQREGAETPFLRDPALSKEYVDLGQVLQYSLEQLEAQAVYPDLVVLMEITFPFRPPGLLDDMIAQIARGGYDTVVAAKAENRAVWTDRDGAMVQLVEGLTPRQFKAPTFIELRGVGCVTHPEFIRQGVLYGPRMGIFELEHPYAHLEVRGDHEVQLAGRLIEEWSRESAQTGGAGGQPATAAREAR